MCIGEIASLTEIWEEGGARFGRLDNGSVVPLAFVPEAELGAPLLVHLGIPVEVLDEETARDAQSLRAAAMEQKGATR